jgi:hypothetical protein
MRYLIAILLLMPSTVTAQQASRDLGKHVADPVPSATVNCLEVPLEIRKLYPNPDGSCVLLSSGLGGVHANDPKAWSLPFNTQYGEAERGGANPERIAHIFAQRGIQAYNVTGQPSIPMARWAVKTGRACAIGFDYEHFQLVWGYDSSRKVWFIWDNRYPEFISEYTEADFEQMHDRSGRWVIVLDKPSDRVPKPRPW